MKLQRIASGQFIHVLIASLLFLTLALSVMPSAAKNPTIPIGCPDGQVLSNGECVDVIDAPPIQIVRQDEEQPETDIDPGDIVLTPAATQTPIEIDIEDRENLPTPSASSLPDIDVMPESETTGYVTVHKYDCGPNLTAYQMSLEALRASCSPQANVAFSASNDAEGQQGIVAQATTGADGLAFLQIANPGVVVVAEVLPENYGQPIVTCGLIIGSDPALGALQVRSDASETLKFNGDDQFYCDWFNVGQPDPGETGEISVQKFVCPDTLDAYAFDLAALQAGCVDPLAGIEFRLLDGNQVAQVGATGATGLVDFAAIEPGLYGLVEGKPDEFGPARVFCQSTLADQPATGLTEVPVSEGIGIAVDIQAGQATDCVWFNIPAEDPGSIEIWKFVCDVDPGEAVYQVVDTIPGCEPLDGIEFTLESQAGSGTIVTGDPTPGQALWTGLPTATYTVTETVPEGYGDPVVYCGHWLSDLPATPFDPDVTNASITFDLDPGMTVRCFWINLPLEDGSITIYKHYCPAGYDLYASGVDPWIDCTGNANGIGFWLDGGNYQQTGDLVDSAVVWEGLASGEHSISEDVPPGMKSVFVLKCEGNSAPLIQNYPISVGPDFQLYVEPGDEIVCHWYNVPKATHASITVVKFACWTKTFVSQDYCRRYEHGVGFGLSKHGSGEQWSFVASGTTNATGVLVFNGLDAGTYQIDEIGAHWCYATADHTDSQGYLLVDKNDVTVWVYNCGVDQPKPTPIDFPNTGVAPSASSPAMDAAPVVPANTAAILDWRQWAGALDSRLTAPFAASGKPLSIEIESIGVSASIESLEIVDGAFQEPTTADQVAWYRDTAWLGETGNVVLAGHLNYWGVPEGVFFQLDKTAIGDKIVVVSESGERFEYEVTSVRLLPTGPAELQSVTAETGSETLTLITCGGEWDSSSQSYLHRTVVQAERVG